MAEKDKSVEPRRVYVAPKLETVEVVAEEALLATCAFDGAAAPAIMQGAPCDVCFSSS